MKNFVVGHIDFFNHELTLEKIQAETWQLAVIEHSKYPYKGSDDSPMCRPEGLRETYPDMEEDEAFRQACFDCDSMMSWIEI